MHDRVARIAIPAPAIGLAAAAVAATYVRPLRDAVNLHVVEGVVTVALVLILFDGGRYLGGRRFRESALPILTLGVVGTFATAALIACVARLIFTHDWTLALILGAALAPTDPAVVFAVLPGKNIDSQTSAVLEGESGFNDPAAIALLLGFVNLATHADDSVASIVGVFALSMGVGAAMGCLGGRALRALVEPRRTEHGAAASLYAIGGVLLLYGATSLAHGSGFLAVLVAGLVSVNSTSTGARRHPTERLQARVATVGELVAFVALGLTINLHVVFAGNVWPVGLAIFAVLALVIRPLVCAPLLALVRTPKRDSALIAWAGLKGAVPLLLGAFVVSGGVPQAGRLYAIIVVVVALSVVVQGGSVGWVATRLGVTRESTGPDAAS